MKQQVYSVPRLPLVGEGRGRGSGRGGEGEWEREGEGRMGKTASSVGTTHTMKC